MCNCKGSLPTSVTLRLRAMELAVASLSGIGHNNEALAQRFTQVHAMLLGDVTEESLKPSALIVPQKGQLSAQAVLDQKAIRILPRSLTSQPLAAMVESVSVGQMAQMRAHRVMDTVSESEFRLLETALATEGLTFNMSVNEIRDWIQRRDENQPST